MTQGRPTYRLVCSVHGRGALHSGTRASVQVVAQWMDVRYPACQHWVEAVETPEPGEDKKEEQP